MCIKKLILTAILSSALIISCNEKKEVNLIKLYEACLQGKTTEKLSIPSTFNDETPNKIFACVDKQSELRIGSLKDIEVKNYIRQGNNLSTLDEKDRNKLKDIPNLYIEMYLHLSISDAARYKLWLETRKNSGNMVFTFNNESMGALFINDAMKKPYILITFDRDIEMADKFYNRFRDLIVRNE